MRLIDADKIRYSWQIDADGTEHDGVTLESVVDKIPTEEAIPLSVIENIKAEIGNNVEWHFKNHQEDIAQIYSDCLNIIDKHLGKEQE